MKKLVFNIIIALAFSSLKVNAQNDVFVKHIQPVTYKVNEQTKFDIANKFGNITIENSDNPNITIEVKIEVKNSTKKKADEIFNKIKINIAKEDNIVKAYTEFEQFTLKNIKLDVNYNVKMPSYMALNLRNKYGDVFIGEVRNKTEIHVKYGSLNLGRLLDGNEKPLSVVQLEYCDNSTIEEFNWGKLVMKYSDVSVRKGKALIVLSKYSDLKISNFASLVAESKYDDFTIKNIKNIVMDAKYSDVEIDGLHRKLDLVNKYGDISVDNVSPMFKYINIESAYADIDVDFSKKSNFIIDVKCTYCDLDYDNIYVQKRIKDTHTEHIIGISGDADSPRKGEVFIESKYGDVDIEF